VIEPRRRLADLSGCNELAVWYRSTEHIDERSLAPLNEVLSDEERERRDRFVFPGDRRDFAAAHALLRNALSLYGTTAPGAWSFEKDRHGKPSIVSSQAGSPPLVFNLSHTRGLVACVIARGTSVGVDVERCSRLVNAREIASRFFSGPELDILLRCEPKDYASRFIELWTLKEAYIKAVGVGLGVPLDSFGFQFEDNSRLRFKSAAGDGDAWQFWLAAPSEDARVAIAAARGSRQRPWRIAFHEGQDESTSDVTLLRWSDSRDDGEGG
jgi:4'-phosphopantetheinyl transferase